MKTLSLLQIGDIHYPKYKNEQTVDIKFGGAEGIENSVGGRKLAIVLKEIDTQVRSKSIENILFMGDFTDKGSCEEFKNCLKTLCCSLGTNLHKCISVPGNHDLTSYVDDFERHKDLYVKFNEFEEINNEHELQGFKIFYDSFKHHDHLEKNYNTSITTINTALGCNEITFVEKFKSLIDSLGRDKIRELIGEDFHRHFDCPFVDRNVFDDIKQKSNDGLMSIIIAHHNLLPQRIPRFALFPEIINSGSTRDVFASIPQPVIYLHGHTHDEFIDIINHADNYRNIGVIAISAPLMSEGFNKISIVFSDKNTPLSIAVEQIRFDGAELKSKQNRNFIFYPDKEIFNFLSQKENEILNRIRSENDGLRYDLFKGEEDCINNLECVGLVKVDKKVAGSRESWSVSSAQ